MFTFETGASALSLGFIANATVESAAENKAQLAVNVQHKSTGGSTGFSFNAGDRMADKFFEQVDEELADKTTQPTARKSEASHVDAPAGTPASPSTPEQQGVVHVSSNPEGGDVLLDGAFVGNAPAVLKLSSGKHTLAVQESGYAPWSRGLSAMAGSDVHLNAVLSKQ